MSTYVQGHNTDNWHWCRNCSQYPKTIEKTQTTRPKGDLCNQCLAKEKVNDCTP